MRFHLLVLAALAVPAFAQLTAPPSGFVERWGAPRSGSMDTNGVGTFTYRSEGILVESRFVGGFSERIVYRSEAMDTQTVERLLLTNSDECLWDALRLPGRRREPGVIEEWMRSDEQAMAVWTSDGLTLLGDGWNRYVAEMSRDEAITNTTTLPQSNRSAASLRTESVKTEQSPLGFWQTLPSVSPAVVVNVRRDGELKWTVLTERGVYDWPGLWRKDPDGISGRLVLTEVSQEEDSAGRLMGTLVRESTISMRLVATGNTPAARSRLWPWKNRQEVVVRRVKSMPRWKPRNPDQRPQVGDAKGDVLQLLGKPKGSMTARGQEVWVYGWGEVWMSGDKVTRVK